MPGLLGEEVLFKKKEQTWFQGVSSQESETRTERRKNPTKIHSKGEQQNQGKKKKKENGNFRSLNTSIKRGSTMQEVAISNTQRKKVLSLKGIDS